MLKVKRFFLIFITAFSAVLFFAGCGLEDYMYIESISQSNITQTILNTATVHIPSSFAGSGMSGFHFIIFYRIYISDELATPVGYTANGNDEYLYINSVLASDYNYFKSKIENNSNDDMYKLFQDRGFKYLCLENDEDINALLNSSVLGKSILFEFPSDFSFNQYPKMTVNGVSHNLFRSTDGYSALPDPYFCCIPNFWSSKVTTGDGRIDSTINADIVDKNNIQDGHRNYAYTAMYITATAMDDTTITSVYGTPALVHVFRLTQKN